MIDHDQDESEAPCECSMVSSCCKVPALGGVDEDAYGHLTGVCSECHQQASFEPDLQPDL